MPVDLEAKLAELCALWDESVAPVDVAEILGRDTVDVGDLDDLDDQGADPPADRCVRSGCSRRRRARRRSRRCAHQGWRRPPDLHRRPGCDDGRLPEPDDDLRLAEERLLRQVSRRGRAGHTGHGSLGSQPSRSTTDSMSWRPAWPPSSRARRQSSRDGSWDGVDR